MSNKSVGNKFEQEWCEILRDHGFWSKAYPTGQGQPADVEGVKDNEHFLFECKDCTSGNFNLSRVESNQILAYQYYAMCGNGNYYFVININDTICIVHGSIIMAAINSGIKKIKFKDIDKLNVDWWFNTHGNKNK